MIKTLLIEIKDNKAAVTLTSYNGKVSLLYRNNFYFKPLIGKILFDSTWIRKMQTELRKVTAFETIENFVLIINTKGTFSKTEILYFSPQIDLTKELSLIKAKIQVQNGKLLHLIDFKTTFISRDNKGIKLALCYEVISKNLYRQIIDAFYANNLKFTKIISSIETIKNALLVLKQKDKVIFDVDIEAKHTLISIMKNGTYLEIIKLRGGMDIIYKNIARKMQISSTTARNLFMSFGFIPPEAVVDNKIIYTKRDSTGDQNTFRKKDLSNYITEIVNDFFAEIKGFLNRYAAFNPALIFSGEISRLVGFESYAQIALSAPSQVSIYSSKIIGLCQHDALIVVGALEQINKNIIIKQGKEKMFKGDNYLLKKQHKLLFLATKINRMYNYI